jgi:hypothetical protein
MNRHFKLLLVVLISLGAAAAEIEGAKFSDSVKVDGETLILNGAGLRTATIFKAKVYAGALYLKEKLRDAEAILSSASPKQIQMEFFREIAGADVAKAWDHSFEESCESDCASQKSQLEKLKTLMPSVKAGDRMAYTFRKGSVEIGLNSKSLGKIEGEGFPRTLLSTWIGKHPPTETLKEGLLGSSGTP